MSVIPDCLLLSIRTWCIPMFMVLSDDIQEQYICEKYNAEILHSLLYYLNLQSPSFATVVNDINIKGKPGKVKW